MKTVSASSKINITFMFAICMCSFPVLYAQDPIADSSYGNFESYAHKLGLYVYSIGKFSNFEIKTEQNDDEEIEYAPNGNQNLGLGFSYRNLSFGAAFKFGFLNTDNHIYGKTKSLDLQLDIYKRKYLFNANVQYYKNYYWRNPEDFIDNWDIKDSAVVRSDIATSTLGINGLYIFNHEHFSFKAAFQNTERQKSSAGSWLVGSRFSIYSVRADSSLVPEELLEMNYQKDSITGTSAINLGISGGYAYTFVFKQYFYFSIAAMFGLNLQGVTKYMDEEPVDEDGGISSNTFFRTALGCNKPTHYYGITFSSDSFVINSSEKAEVAYSYGKIKLYYGRRFDLNSKK